MELADPIKWIQFALQFNSDYAQFIQLRSGELEINASNYKVIEGQNAQVLISWNSNVTLKSTNKPFFIWNLKLLVHAMPYNYWN